MLFLCWLMFSLFTFVGAVCWCIGLDVDTQGEMRRVTVPAILAIFCAIVILAIGIPLMVYCALMLSVVYAITAMVRMAIRLVFKR